MARTALMVTTKTRTIKTATRTSLRTSKTSKSKTSPSPKAVTNTTRPVLTLTTSRQIQNTSKSSNPTSRDLSSIASTISLDCLHGHGSIRIITRQCWLMCMSISRIRRSMWSSSPVNLLSRFWRLCSWFLWRVRFCCQNQSKISLTTKTAYWDNPSTTSLHSSNWTNSSP